jgi:hypothetical protein
MDNTQGKNKPLMIPFDYPKTLYLNRVNAAFWVSNFNFWFNVSHNKIASYFSYSIPARKDCREELSKNGRIGSNDTIFVS